MYFNLYGCGFAGLVSALGMCKNKHQINAIDIDIKKISLLQNNDLTQTPIELQSYCRKYFNNELSFYESGKEPTQPVANILTVPSPLIDNELSLESILNCLKHIANLAPQDHISDVIIRSTLPINAIKKIRKKLKEQSQRFNLYYVPEFMREGTGLNDWDMPPLSIIGTDDISNIPVFISQLFKHTQLRPMSFNEAISVKLFSNAFHAMKVSFANEALRICHRENISATTVMKEFCNDDKLNISKKYLNPGFPWGGSCLGKDTSQLANMYTDLPLLNAIIDSNTVHFKFIKNKILSENVKHISVVGLGFKEDVQDFRESPTIQLIKDILSEKKIETVNILEEQVNIKELFNNNKKINLISDISDIGDNDFVILQKNNNKKLHPSASNVVLEV